MSKYLVKLYYEATARIEVEAENVDDAQEAAIELVNTGPDLDCDLQEVEIRPVDE